MCAHEENLLSHDNYLSSALISRVPTDTRKDLFDLKIVSTMKSLETHCFLWAQRRASTWPAIVSAFSNARYSYMSLHDMNKPLTGVCEPTLLSYCALGGR